MACLDLHYYVNVHSGGIKEKEEEECNHSPITLNDLKPESELKASPTKSLDTESV